eukprot:TRINITY_DN23430_c0_g1_i1.p1 TRINITY_DN23430_c0_g1~~TRINITY_DN23430_c0_g1_i1.p1  ORF type:complete len:370 (+),score=84.31 TRINITY_DN23430_c0_g1_i1:78-1112(+)
MGAAWCGRVEDPAQGAAEVQPPPPVPAPADVGQLEGAGGLTPGDGEASAPAVHADQLEGGKLEGVASLTLADGEASARAVLEREEALMRTEFEERAEVSGNERYARKGITGAKIWDLKAREDARKQRQAEAAAAGAADHPGPHRVQLSVYRLGPVGYHSAVAVCGLEVYFDGTAAAFVSDLSRPGVQICNPECGPIGEFQEAIDMGESPLSSYRIGRVVAELAPQWSIGSYHLLQNNCNHFAEAMINMLGCPGRPPTWVNRAAICAGVMIPDCVFNWAARRSGLQRQRLDTGREHCSCGARFGLCTARNYCSACAYPKCGQCLSVAARRATLEAPYGGGCCSDC